MKSLTKLGLLSLIAVLAIASGCSKKPKNITPIPVGGNGPAVAPTTETVLPGKERPLVSNPNGFGKTLNDVNGPRVTNFTPDTGAGAGANLGSTGLKPLSDNDPFANRTEDAATLAGDTVYFDYDKAAVKSSELPKLGAVADHLKSHPDVNLKIAGHADERGTEEYNRALSERRALAVREQLINKGVSADRITTEPYGEDKPADPGHDEAAWAKNRRGEFILLVPNAVR